MFQGARAGSPLLPGWIERNFIITIIIIIVYNRILCAHAESCVRWL